MGTRQSISAAAQDDEIIENLNPDEWHFPKIKIVEYYSANRDARKQKPIEKPEPVKGKWLPLKELVLKVKKDVEEDCELTFPMFDAVLFIKRHHHIIVRVHIGEEKYIDIFLTRQQLFAYQLDKKYSDLLKFDD